MADTKLSALTTSPTVSLLYGELAGTSFAITPSNVVGAVVSKTVNYSVVAADTNTHFDNAGAAGAVNFTLPAAVLGLRYTFTVYAAQSVTVTATSPARIAIGPLNSAAAGNVSNSTPFGVITIEAHGTNQWVATSATGAWTVT